MRVRDETYLGKELIDIIIIRECEMSYDLVSIKNLDMRKRYE